ncbi:MAG TPA: helix-turn-helix transcriptional regulator [Polyangiaceae bacterium]|nr:helix-turn-helix transcriptional regulator [Polyangiaceae bacterium]
MRRLDPERALKDVGRRVAELRRARGWTQEAFAERIGLQANNLQRIELGMQNLTVRSLVRLANGLGVALGALFEAPASRIVRAGRPPTAR